MSIALHVRTMPNEQITHSNGPRNNTREGELTPSHPVARGDQGAQHATRVAGEKTTEVGSSHATGSLQSKASELKNQLANKLPGEQIGHAAEAAKSRVENVVDSAKEVVGSAKEGARELIDGARDRASSSYDWARDQTAIARDRAADVAHRAGDLAREGSRVAADRARDVSRNVGGFASMHALPLAMVGLSLGWLAWSIRRERSRRDELVLVEIDYATLPTPQRTVGRPYGDIPERPIGSIGYDDPRY